MRKYRIAIAAAALLTAQISFAAAPAAEDDMSSHSCRTIVKACVKAGYAHKGFWKDCMHPALLNQPVKGITLATTDVKSCRDFKITHMEKELQQLKSVQ